jgi:hypothetical protein
MSRGFSSLHDFFILSPFSQAALSPPFHPHSYMSGFSLGASWVFSIH